MKFAALPSRVNPEAPRDNLIIVTTATQEAGRARMLEYMSDDPGMIFYRIVKRPDGNILLKKLRIKPNSEVTKTIVVSADFEDDE